MLSDAEMIKSPVTWPGATLPMIKRMPDGPMLGVVLENESTRVYLGNMLTIDLSTARYVQYPSTEAMVEDGWRID